VKLLRHATVIIDASAILLSHSVLLLLFFLFFLGVFIIAAS
jgi:hypothetical protein